MQTKNVYYSTKPDRVMVTAKGDKALIEFPTDVTEVANEEGTQWCAKVVYSIVTFARKNLKQIVERNYDAWLKIAQIVAPSETQLSNDDIANALIELAELIATQDDALVEIAEMMAEGE